MTMRALGLVAAFVAVAVACSPDETGVIPTGDVAEEDAVEEVVPFDAPSFDVPPRDVTQDVVTRCVGDNDCAATPMTPRCDRGAGLCRACLSSPDTCPSGSYCDATFRCVPGCADDGDCGGDTDGGVPDGGSRRRCNAATHACVDCLADLDCPSSLICSRNRCAMGCSDARPCPAGSDCCDGVCADLLHDATRCGSCGHACDPGATCCGGVCFNLNTDPRHCGGCDTRCAVANGVAGCAAGRCSVASCAPGFGDCDSNAANGCEAGLNSNATHCGRCGNACPSGPRVTAGCTAGVCASVCAAGYLHCSSNPMDGCEVDPSSDRNNCGACGRVCSNAHATGGCVSGACTVSACDTGYADCNRVAADGCEVATASDPFNCGACLRVCPSGPFSMATCTAGTCGTRCLAGHADCDGNPANGCEVDLATDASHCGACPNACPTRAHATPACTAGVCDILCTGSYRDCDGNAANGCEVDALTDASHCGSCPNACATPHATPVCSGGACAVSACATGFGNCNGLVADGCETSTTGDLLNCGGCFRACPAAPYASPTCTSGVCGITCSTGRANCDGNATNGCEVALDSDAAHCGSCTTACPAGQVCSAGRCTASCTAPLLVCSGACVNTQTDAAHCGGCGRACTLPHATATCASGACAIAACDPGWGNCNGLPADGCEAPLTADPANCGGCFRACGTGPYATAVCSSGVCGVTCMAGHGDCNGVATDGCEATFAVDPTHCGSCAVACPSVSGGTPTCSGGVCGASCATGYRDCDLRASNGCEVDVRTDAANCGACGTACSVVNGVAGCAASRCNIASCSTGFADCDGVVTNGCEVATATDSSNCGACGTICTGGMICVTGRCTLVNPFPSTGTEGAFAPSVNVTLAPGVHNFTTISIPTGVTVTTNGSGVLDLRATGDITIAGSIDVTGGTGGTGNRTTGGGGGGATGARTTAGVGVGGTGGAAPGGSAAAGCTVNAPGGAYGGGAGGVGAATVGGGGGGGAGGGGGGLVGGSCVAGTGGGGATAGAGGQAGGAPYDGQPGQTGMDACGGLAAGGGGGSVGMAAASDLAMATTFQAGSGGGGGSGSYGSGLSAAEGGGGGGGGAVRLATPTRITVSGTIRADGGAGGNGSDANTTCFAAEGGSGGGGGSGGAIYLAAPTLNVTGTLSAAGATGGRRGANLSGGDGGNGGLGRIRVSAVTTTCTLAGTLSPPARSGCAAANTAGYAYVAAYPR